MGETCGMRLVHQNLNGPEKCATCLSIERKERKKSKAESDYMRWVKDPNRQASAAKAAEEIQLYKREIQKLEHDKANRYTNIGSNRRLPN